MKRESQISESNLTVNGKRVATRARFLAQLVSELGYEAAERGFAVAVNREVVPRAAWASCALSAGDEIEIVGAVQGG